MYKDVEMIDADSVPEQEGYKVLELRPLARQMRRLCLVLALAPVGAGVLGHSSRAMADDIVTAVCSTGGSVSAHQGTSSEEDTPCIESSQDEYKAVAANAPSSVLHAPRQAQLSEPPPLPPVPVLPDEPGANVVILGPDEAPAKALGDGSLAIGYNAQTDKTAQSSLAIGDQAYAKGKYSLSFGRMTQAHGENSLAIGSYSLAEGKNSLAIGYGALATQEDSISIGFENAASGFKGITIGAGNNATTATSQVIGNDNKVDSSIAGGDALILGDSNTASGLLDNAVVIGENNTATDTVGGVVLGTGNSIGADHGLAIGHAVSATGPDAMAIGSEASATSRHDIAIGFGANTGELARSSLAFGDHATSDGVGAVAVGLSTYAQSKNAIAIGGGGAAGEGVLNPKESTVAGADNAIAIGGNADGGTRASGVSSLALGARADASAAQAVAIGGVQTSYFTEGVVLPPTTASGVGAVAIGADLVSGAVASGDSAIAIGGQSDATADNAVAIGVAARAGVADSVALGNGSVTADVVATDKVTIADNDYDFAGAAPKSTVSIGDVGSERTLTNMAAGRLNATSTDAINGSQLFATNRQVGTNATAIGANKTAIDENTTAIEGNIAEISDLNDALANAGIDENVVHFDADDHGQISLAESGTRITNLADAVLAIDSTDAVSGRQLFATNQKVAANLTAIDANKTAIADNSAQIVALANGGSIGNNPYMVTSAYGDKTASAMGEGSIALGADSHSDTRDSVAIGYGARVTRENSIAIGSGSIAGEAPKLRAYRSLGSTYDYESEYAGNAEFGEMSIGSDGYERRITHVAPGRVTADSTDAINGSQLFVNTQKLDEKISALDGRVNKLEDGSGGGSNGGSAGGSDHFKDNSSGGKADASGEDSIAIGGDSRAASNGGVAIGEGSVADREGMDGKAEAFSGTDVASKQGAVSMGSDGNERQITHVAGGTEDTDAVNVRQLHAVQEGSVNYDRKKDGSVDYNSMTLGKKGSGPVQIHNVAAGTAPNDAVNVSQLQAMDSRYASAYDHLSDEIDEVESKASAGIAAIAAMGDAPYVAGKLTYHVGSGYYNGESALGVNLRHTADNGRWSVDFGVGTSAGDMDTAVSLGVSGVIN